MVLFWIGSVYLVCTSVSINLIEFNDCGYCNLFCKLILDKLVRGGTSDNQIRAAQTVCYQIKNKFSTHQMREKVSLLTDGQIGSKIGGLL